MGKKNYCFQKNHPESEATFQKYYGHLSYQKLKFGLDINSKKMEREGGEGERWNGREGGREGRYANLWGRKSHSAKKNFENVEKCVRPFQ